MTSYNKCLYIIQIPKNISDILLFDTVAPFASILGHLCTTIGDPVLAGVEFSTGLVGVTDDEFPSFSTNCILPSASGNTLG